MLNSRREQVAMLSERDVLIQPRGAGLHAGNYGVTILDCIIVEWQNISS